jgi:hypothetical protein
MSLDRHCRFGPRVAAHSLTARARPAGGGAPICLDQGEIGTLGCVLVSEGKRYILGSGHVLSLRGQAQIGAPVYQPSSDDQANRIGALYANNLVQYDSPNWLDAGIALADPGKVSAKIGDLGFPKGTALPPPVGALVRICGAASGVSPGIVKGVDQPAQIDYGIGDSGPVAQFYGMTICTPYAQAGDSGSVVFDDDDRVVGLHVGGDGSISVFCPIQHVLAYWPGFDIATGD